MVHDLVVTAPTRGAIHSTKIQIGPTGKSGPPQKANQFFRTFPVGPKFPEILVEWIAP